LNGEDRSFGGIDLFIDLIPSKCWFSNVRTTVHSTDWDRLRKHIYARAVNCCECCGASPFTSDGIRLEAHERWHYDDKKKVQKLMRLVALCNTCHRSTHFGPASILGKREEATQHLKQVRGFTDSEVKLHIANAFSLWRERSSHNWELDITLITSNGIKLADVSERVIKVVKIHTADNKADLGTKRVGWPIFAKVVSSIIVCKSNSYYEVCQFYYSILRKNNQ
jgi:hypothetical protein